jgi:hypothetical protein
VAHTARELMITDYPTATTDQAPQRASPAAVILDSAGRPRWVVGPAGEGALLVVPPSCRVHDLLADLSVLSLLADGLPAVVVAEAGTVQGIVLASTLRDELESRRIEDGAVTGTLGELVDVETPGNPRSIGVITIWCRHCGRPNELEEYPESGQLCVSGQHPLEADWA